MLKCLDSSVKCAYVTPPPKPFVGHGGGVALLTDIFPMIKKLQRYGNNIERQINGMEASLCRAVYSPPLTLEPYLFIPPTSDVCIQEAGEDLLHLNTSFPADVCFMAVST